MMTKTLTDLIVEAAQVLKSHDADKFADVIRWMLAREQDERKTRGQRKRKQVLYTERGEKIELYRDVVRTLEEQKHEQRS